LNDTSIAAESRAVIRHALETNDPWLAQLIKRADAGETPEANDADSSRKKIEALAEIICGGGDQSAAALLVLMGTNTPRIPKYWLIQLSILLLLAAVN